MKRFIPFFILLIFANAFFSCGVYRVSKVITNYENTEKQPIDTSITYHYPVITPASGTKQMQVKGGVSVSCEVIEFEPIRSSKYIEHVTYADPNRLGYDIFESFEEPYFDVEPKEVMFKIRLKNNQERTLKLIDVPIVYIADGVQ